MGTDRNPRSRGTWDYQSNVRIDQKLIPAPVLNTIAWDDGQGHDFGTAERSCERRSDRMMPATDESDCQWRIQ